MKVTIEVQPEVLDEIIAKEILDHVKYTYNDLTKEGYVHPDDRIYWRKMLPCLIEVYKYWVPSHLSVNTATYEALNTTSTYDYLKEGVYER